MRPGMMSGRIAVGLLALGAAVCNAGACLPDAIPEGSRQYIFSNAGEPMPIGLFEQAWESSYFMTALAKILIEEVLGYHTTISEEAGGSAITVPYALAGCTEYNKADKQFFSLCVNETRMHVCVDSWWATYSNVVESMRTSVEFAYLAPNDLGSMGYQGLESIYLSDVVLQKALNSDGRILDYYRGFNRSYGDPTKFFENIENISSSSIRFCNNTDFMKNSSMSAYARWTGDVEGVEVIANGDKFDYIGKCFDDKWWVSPACRGDPRTCIPVITAGTGWKAQALMHWSTVYGMPTAIGVAQTWGDYVSLVNNHVILFYWWVPDATFVLQQPHAITFPLHVAQEWAEGNMKTAATDTYINKATSSNFPNKAPQVNSFISNIFFELGEVQDLLLEVASGSTSSAVACRWIQDNRPRWEGWLPVETNCLKGFGMVDGEGRYLSSRLNATTCAVCSPGHFSEEVLDKQGATHRCRLCSPGQSQSKSATSACEPCARGSHTQVFGASVCSICKQGEYQNEEGQQGCLPCSNGTTTRLLGASKADDCVCGESFIQDGAVCTSCGEGLLCPIGSTLEKLRNASGEEDPQVLEGYNADPLNPLHVYRCRVNCPGGRPGTCTGGHVGLTCGECSSGQFSIGDGCSACGGEVVGLWILAIALFVVGISSFHYLLSSPYSSKASVLTCTTCTLGMTVAVFQNLGIFKTVDIPWPKELADFLAVFRVFLLDLDHLGFSCLAGGPVQRYASSCVAFFAVVGGLFAMTVLTNLLLPERMSQWKWQKWKAMSTTGQFLQVGFTTMTNVSLLPFVCIRHPSGQEGVLKYTSIFCGSPEHAVMQVFGSFTLGLCSLFLAACFYAAWQAPVWSGMAKQGAIRFLIFRFRPDVWWYGITLLTRGPLLSLPVVFAPNYPVIQLVCLLAIMLASFFAQLWFLPWKAPILNLVDGITNAQLIVLLGLGLGRVEADGPSVGFLDYVASITSASITSLLLFLMLLALLSLCYRKGLGSGAGELRVMNLGSAVGGDQIAFALDLLSKSEIPEAHVRKIIDNLCIYDARQLNHSILLLSTELGVASANAQKITRTRITSRGLSSFTTDAVHLRESLKNVSRRLSVAIGISQEEAEKGNRNLLSEEVDAESEEVDAETEEVDAETAESNVEPTSSRWV